MFYVQSRLALSTHRIEKFNIFNSNMQLANTSARCLRSFAASIAWLELFALLAIHTISSASYSEKIYSLFIAVIIQCLAVFVAACSHSGLLLSIVIHTIVTVGAIYVDFTADFTALDSAQDLKLPMLITLSFLSFVYSILAVTILYSLPKKKATESSTSYPVVAKSNNVKSPLLQSETKEDFGRSLMADDDYSTDVSEIIVNSPGAILCLPIRVSCCLTFMTLLLPLGLVLSSFRACYQRCKKGKASEILHLPSKIDKPMGGYACQMVFKHSFDIDKLRQITVALSEECGIDKSYVRVDLEEEPPHGDFPKKSGPMKSNHYVGEGSGPTGKENWLKSMDVLNMGDGKDTVIWMRVWNSIETGKPSVIHWKGPGQVWDGTSCFNFTKEMIHRYHDGEPCTTINQDGKLILSKEVKTKLDQSSFFKFLCWHQPTSIMYNISRTCWRFFGCASGGAPDQVAAVINLDEADTKLFAKAAKQQGLKPFAAMTWCVTEAHTKVVGQQVDRIIMQASMQSRAYEPSFPKRNVIGDWLIGPVQRLDQGGVYTKERSQTEYNNLIKELTEFAPNSDVANTFQAKAYGWNQKGASMFEMHPFYPHDIGIFGPSVFFNNYGLRTFHSASGIVSWNWCAPYYLGCNTICVNGRNSIALASLVIGQELLDSVRNQMWIEMKKIMDSA